MSIDQSPHLHIAFGLCVSFPFPVHQLPQASEDRTPDVRVEIGTIPTPLPDFAHQGYNTLTEAEVQISHTGDMLLTNAQARFWAGHGNHIVIEPCEDAPPTRFRHFTLYTCLPAILNQRGLLALHANAVLGPQGALAFTGRSGAGKSTLFAALLARGLPMLADDVTAVVCTPGDHPHVLPGYPSYRLCADALEQLAPPTTFTRHLAGPRNKYLLLTPEANLHRTPAPLHSIFILHTHSGDELKIEPLSGLRAFQHLRENCYNPAAALLAEAAFANLNHVVQHCAFYLVQRPHHRWTIDELCDRLLALSQTGLPGQRESHG